jgi:hypothetical protein
MGGTSATTDLGDIWSIEAWIKRGDQATQGQYLLSKPNGGYGMYLQNNNLCAVRASAVVLAASTITIDQNVHHCVVTKNGAAVKVYVDGVDVTGTVTNSTCANTAYWLGLGSDNGANPVTSVLMDEVAIYPTALALSRVQAHYNAGITSPTGGVVVANGKQITVGTSPTLVFSGTGFFVLRNAGSASVFLGGSGVTTTTGFELPTASPYIQVTTHAGDSIYAVVASATQRLDSLEVD